MDKILVSGITGFVGSNLKPYLQSSFEVQGVSRKENADENIISYEALDGNVLNSAKAFVHLAGKAHDLKRTSEEKEYFTVNTELTKEVYKKFLSSSCDTFIFLSSVKAVADTVVGVLDENAVPDPKTAYGKSKLAAEEFLLQQRLPVGKYLYIIRPAMIHGPNNKGNLNLLYQVVRKGIPYPLGAFKNERSFVSVENLCFAIHQLIKNTPSSGVYHISDDGSLSTVRLVELIGEAAGKKPIVLQLPKGLIQGLAKIGDRLHLPFTTERLDKLTENFVVSNKKLRKSLGASFPVGIEEGIKSTIDSFKK